MRWRGRTLQGLPSGPRTIPGARGCWGGCWGTAILFDSTCGGRGGVRGRGSEREFGDGACVLFSCRLGGRLVELVLEQVKLLPTCARGRRVTSNERSRSRVLSRQSSLALRPRHPREHQPLSQSSSTLNLASQSYSESKQAVPALPQLTQTPLADEYTCIVPRLPPVPGGVRGRSCYCPPSTYTFIHGQDPTDSSIAVLDRSPSAARSSPGRRCRDQELHPPPQGCSLLDVP